MAEESHAEVVWKGKLKFEGRSEFDQAIQIDASPPLGDNAGIKPMELLLVTLAGCTGQTIVSLLQKMRQDIGAFSIRAHGVKSPAHPRVFTEIRLEIEASGPNLDQAAVEKALRMTEDKYCPVFAMLKKSVDIQTAITISAAPGTPA